ncbi:MAG: SpoIIE family protein phosphatase, partial [Sulfuricaulis sp.]|nr:SpoIIE family protein phosphatase [Sulfuricaulis sp.]
TEAADGNDILFGEERLEQALRETPGHDAPALTGSVLGAVRRFAGDALQSDDITLLAVRLLPAEK